MDEQEVRKAKRFNIIAFVILCICIIAFTGLILYLINLPIDPCLERDKLEQMTGSGYLALVHDTCYELENGEELAVLCDFSAWTQGQPEIIGNHVLTIKLGDEYEIAFYTGDPGGAVKAYYGYSDKNHLDTAWYTVPADTASKLAAYIEANGTLREPLLGPGSWFTIDE